MVQLVREGRAGWPVFTSTEPVAKVWDTPSWVGRDPYRFERIAVQQLAPEPAAAT